MLESRSWSTPCMCQEASFKRWAFLVPSVQWVLEELTAIMRPGAFENGSLSASLGV